MTFTDTLLADADPVWEAIYDHPMVRGIGDGTLDPAPFRWWLRQDYVYLVAYNRVFALGAAKAPDLERMRRFADLLEETLTTEMDYHREFAAEFGLDAADLEATAPAPTTRGYTDFLVRTAALGTFGDLVAAILPCMWGFNDTAERLAAAGRPDEPRYAAWIDAYASEEFGALADWCRALLDDVAAEAAPATRDRYRERFLTSARYEYRFWDAAWNCEEWDVDVSDV